jgi:monoamine oxidase
MESDREALLPVMLAPATVYRELLYRPVGQLSGWIGERFEILASPGLTLRHQPRPGDVLLRLTPGGGQCVVLTDGHDVATAPRRLPPGHLLLRPRRATARDWEDRSRLSADAEGDFGPDTAKAVVQLKTAPDTVADNLVADPETPAPLDNRQPNRLSASETGYRMTASGRNTGDRRSDWPSAALPPAEEGSSSPGGVKVAIVGAGFAGLMAARSLQSPLFDVTVFEARNQVGGRVRTDRSMIRGKVVEAGAELIGENHQMWITLAKRFGLHLEPISTDADYERLKLKTRVILGGHELSTKEREDIDVKLDKVLKVMGEEAKTVPRLQPWTAASAAKWDAMSVSDRLNQSDMFGPKGPEQDPARAYLEFTIENDNCVAVDRHSYLALLCAISAGRIGTNMLGYWTHTETHRCAGGNDQIATRLAADIKDLRLNSPVEAIEVGEANRVTYRRPDGQHHETFDYVILAGPPTAWPRIISTPGFDPAKFTVSQGPAVKFISSFATEFWKSHGLAPVTKSDDIGSIWEATDKQKSSGGFALTAYSGGGCVKDADTYSRRLDPLYPGYMKERLSAHLVDWPNEPFIKTGYAAPHVGEVTTTVKNLNGSFRKRIFFAGEQVSPGFFGYMEGALESGVFAMHRVTYAAMRSELAPSATSKSPPTRATP